MTGSFKDNLQCSPCPEACLECRSMDSCDKCEDGHTFHPDTNQCLPSSTVAPDMNSNTGGFSSGDSFGSFGSDFSSVAFDGGFSSDSTTSTTVPTTSPPSNNDPPQTATTTPTTTTTTTTTATPTNPTPNNPSTDPQSCP